MKKCIILLLSLLLLHTKIFSKDTFLNSCINIAIQRDKKLLSKKEEIELARRQLWVTSRSFLPNLFLQRRFSRGKTLTEEYQAEDLALRLYQPLYDGGRISAAHKYYSFGYDVAKFEYTKLKEDLVYKIKLAYYEYLAAVSEVNEIEKLLSEIEHFLKKLQNEFTAKAISELDLEEGKIFKQKVENMFEKAKKNEELNKSKLLALINIKSLEEIIYPIPSEIFSTVPEEIAFDLNELKNLLLINNTELKKLKTNIEMAKQREKLVAGKTYPKFYLEGSYGLSGEAFVTEPLELSTVWSGMLRLSWLFGGSSLESSYQQDKAIPREILDVSVRTENTTLDTKLALFDDMKYFVEKKEADTVKLTADAEYEEAEKVLLVELEKFYNEYYYSLLDAKVNYSDLQLKKWRLEVLKKKNALYEVSTVEVMDGVFRVSEAILAYSNAVLKNYIAVSELEKLVLIPLR